MSSVYDEKQNNSHRSKFIPHEAKQHRRSISVTSDNGIRAIKSKISSQRTSMGQKPMPQSPNRHAYRKKGSRIEISPTNQKPEFKLETIKQLRPQLIMKECRLQKRSSESNIQIQKSNTNDKRNSMEQIKEKSASFRRAETFKGFAEKKRFRRATTMKTNVEANVQQAIEYESDNVPVPVRLQSTTSIGSGQNLQNSILYRRHSTMTVGSPLLQVDDCLNDATNEREDNICDDTGMSLIESVSRRETIVQDRTMIIGANETFCQEQGSQYEASSENNSESHNIYSCTESNKSCEQKVMKSEEQTQQVDKNVSQVTAKIKDFPYNEEMSQTMQMKQNRRKVERACLCYPETRLHQVWELFTSVALIIACFMTPFSLAFEQLDNYESDQLFVFSDGWSATDSIVDIVFMIEIFLSLNTSYFDGNSQEFVIDRRKIFCTYFKSWFWVDFLAILPRFMRQLEKGDETNEIIKALAFLKIARIGRLIKLLRLLKIFKTLKQKEKVKSLIQNKMRMSIAKERLFIFSIFSVLFVHTIACLWIMLAVHDDPESENWINVGSFDHNQMGSMYTIGIYWVITTITTVGYGDISATNTLERIVACIIMVIGVIAFSFSTGSLSSIISSANSSQAAYRAKLNVLKQLRLQYGINDTLYMELNAFINFQSEQRHEERENFINELPHRLKTRLAQLLFEDYKKNIFFLQSVQHNEAFIAWLCLNLKPLEVIKDALIQVEQEKLTCISFIKEGEAAYVSERYNNKPYLICTQGDHFGVLDIVFRLREFKKQAEKRHHERDERRWERHAYYQERGEDRSYSSSEESSSDEEDYAVINQKIRCKFTIQATQRCYLLQIEKSALEKMQTEFPEVWESLLSAEFKICLQAIQRKAQIIRQEERLQQHDVSIEQEMLGSSCMEEFVYEESGSDMESFQSAANKAAKQNNQLQQVDASQTQVGNQIVIEVMDASPKTIQDTKLKQDFDALPVLGTKQQLSKRRHSVNVQPATLQQLRNIQCIQEEDSDASDCSSEVKGLPKNGSIREAIGDQQEKGAFSKLSHRGISLRSMKLQHLQEDLSPDPVDGQRQATQGSIQKNQLEITSLNQRQNSSQSLVAKADQFAEVRCFSNSSNEGDAPRSARSNRSHKQSLRPPRQDSLKRSVSEGRGSQKSSDKILGGNCSQKSKRQISNLLDQPFGSPDITRKARKKPMKGLDKDELMVLEGYDEDVRDERSLKKGIKNLTKKSKQRMKMNDDDMVRSLSQNPQWFKKPTMKHILTASDDVDVDDFLLNDQKADFVNSLKKDSFAKPFSPRAAEYEPQKYMQLTVPRKSNSSYRRKSFQKAVSCDAQIPIISIIKPRMSEPMPQTDNQLQNTLIQTLVDKVNMLQQEVQLLKEERRSSMPSVDFERKTMALTQTIEVNILDEPERSTDKFFTSEKSADEKEDKSK